MTPLAKGLLALSLLGVGIGCGIKKPTAPGGSSHPGFTDDSGVAADGQAGSIGAGGDGAGGEDIGGPGGEGPGGFAGAPPATGSGGMGGGLGSGGSVSGGAGGRSSSGGATATGGVAGPGGDGASGGSKGTGGTLSPSGGASGKGGNVATGGAGGFNTTGGVIGSGGFTVTGGVTGTGGFSAPGGTPGTGGFNAPGGTPATGGAAASTGGVSGTGGAVFTSGTCEMPQEIPTNIQATDVAVNTIGRPHVIDVPCAATGSGFVLSFILAQPELVYADTFGANWNTVLSFGDDCDGASGLIQATGTVACSDDACGTSQSQAVAVMGYGRHYLFVSGAHNQTGPVTVHFQHAMVGNGPLALLSTGTGVAQGTTHGTGAVTLCQASAAENSYWWLTCPSYAGGTLTASTCTGTPFDTVLSLQMPRAATLFCADDDPACGVKSRMSAPVPTGAGIQVLTIDGATGSDTGAYSITYKRP